MRINNSQNETSRSNLFVGCTSGPRLFTVDESYLHLFMVVTLGVNNPIYYQSELYHIN